MTNKELMFASLNDLLESGETLMYPIYGILDQGNARSYGYFGFTKSHFLMVLLTPSGKQVRSATRIPLNINSVSVKKTFGILQHSIYIDFKDAMPCKILASEKVLGLDTQIKNFPAFVGHLKSIAGCAESIDLKKTDGSKIRFQYFNVIIYYLLVFLPVIPVMITIIGSKYENYELPAFSELVFEVLKIGAPIILPLVFLSILNRFLFGKIICVVDNSALVLEDTKIPLRYIKKVSYTPKLISKHKVNYTFATLHIDSPEKGEYTTDILHFPLYGLRVIKSHNPNVKIKFTKSGVFTVAFGILAPLVISVIVSFIV
ncbi:MAG: hypothetical protein IKT37_06120 [Clostridia bacterium]|nr:hypothetical protein [Clostridia bacterium]